MEILAQKRDTIACLLFQSTIRSGHIILKKGHFLFCWREGDGKKIDTLCEGAPFISFGPVTFHPL